MGNANSKKKYTKHHLEDDSLPTATSSSLWTSTASLKVDWNDRESILLYEAQREVRNQKQSKWYLVSAPYVVEPGKSFPAVIEGPKGLGSQVVQVKCNTHLSKGQSVLLSLPVVMPLPVAVKAPPAATAVKVDPLKNEQGVWRIWFTKNNYIVRLPLHIKPGEKFYVSIGGQPHLLVTCPPKGRPGKCVRVTYVPRIEGRKETIDAVFETVVPHEASDPGTPFRAIADGAMVTMVCPATININEHHGRKFRFRVPQGMLHQHENESKWHQSDQAYSVDVPDHVKRGDGDAFFATVEGSLMSLTCLPSFDYRLHTKVLFKVYRNEQGKTEARRRGYPTID